jgi:hypothetical protein
MKIQILSSTPNSSAASYSSPLSASSSSSNSSSYYSDDELSEATKKKNQSLKSMSPFTQVFILIRNAVRLFVSSNDNDNLKPNSLFAPEIIEWLLESYMPYCFIWASFSLKDYGLSRMSNGLVEMYNGYRKGGDVKKAGPSVYVTSVVEGIEAHAFRYQEEIKKRPAVLAAAAAKQAKLDRVEAEQLQLADETDEQLCKDTFWKPGCGLPKPPSSYQSQVPQHKLDALTQPKIADEKKILDLKAKRTTKGCQLCNIGKISLFYLNNLIYLRLI